MRINKCHSVVFLAFLTIFLCVGASYTSFAEVKKLVSNTREITIEYSPKFIEFNQINIDNSTKSYIPKFANAYISNSIAAGAPSQFELSELISVPSPNGFEITNIEVGQIAKYHKLLAPTPNYTENGDKYVINKSLYDNCKPSDWVSLSYQGIGRVRHLARITFNACKFDAKNNIIEIPDYIRVTVKFAASSNKNIKQIGDDFAVSINHNETYAFAIADAKDKIQSSKLRNLDEVSNGTWVRLTVMEEGIYKLDASQLSAKGMSVPASLVKTIKVFGHGGDNLSEAVIDSASNDMNELPIIVNTKPNGDLESIIFYGRGVKGFKQRGKNIVHYRNDFGFSNYYFVTFGGRNGLRAIAKENPQGVPINKPNYYTHRICYEEESVNPYPDGSGRTYFGRSYFTSPFMDVLHNLVRSESIKYRIGVAQSASSPNGAGKFVVKQSGNVISTIYLSATTGDYQHVSRNIVEAVAPASQVGLDGRSVLNFEYSNSYSGATPYFDFYEIHYPREFIPIDNELSFVNDASNDGLTEYKINGFTNNPIYGFDVTDLLSPKLLQNMSVTGGLFIFSKDEKNGIASRFFISSKLRTPSNIESFRMANIRGNTPEADVIVITHSQFEESAREYAAYREQKLGLKVSVVKVEDIYNEFSSGIADITAIRDFIKFAYNNWSKKPSFIVLWGDAHYDYRGIQIKSTLYVPTYQSSDGDNSISETATIATDDYIACVAGNDWVIDIPYGRVPVDSKEVGHWYVEKIKLYEGSSSMDNWRTSILLIADDSNTGGKVPDGTMHTWQSEDLSASLPEELLQKKLYLAAYPTENIAGGKRRKPALNRDFIATVNTSGAVIFNWIGHGNPRVLAHEEIFERETSVPQMSNLDKLMFVTAATCDFGRFDLGGIRSGAEELIFSKLGGAIGIFTATRVVGASDNHRLNMKFYSSLFQRKPDGNFPTTGEAVYYAKQVYSDENSRRFILLGDPLVTIHFPKYNIKINSINGEEPDSDHVSLKALSEVQIKAQIFDADGNSPLSDFNGVAYITLLDGDENKSVTDDDNIVYKFISQGAMLNRSTFPVVNGNIDISFVIPKDISFSDNNARLFIYAAADDERTATGSTKSIKVDDIDATAANDGAGPEIKLFLDSYKFKSGDIVRENPLLLVDLWDETGINSTGLGIGHRIEAWIDSEPNPIDLTSQFTTSLTNPKAGSVQKFLYGLKAGRHKIKVRAWDVFNNYSISETEFIIPSEGEVQIFDVLLYPNPIAESGKIAVSHNFAPPFAITLKIFNEMGQKVRQLEENSTSQLETIIDWDGRDEQGSLLPQGAYYYFIQLDSKVNGKIHKSGRLGLIAR